MGILKQHTRKSSIRKSQQEESQVMRPRFKELIDRLDSQNGGDQTKLNAFFTVLLSRGRLSAASEGPSNQQVIDYIREDLERARSEVLRHFNISRKRAKRLVASARSQLTDRDIVNFLRPREDWSKYAVLEKLRITESRYARCVAELRAATPVDRTCVLRFLRAGDKRRRKNPHVAVIDLNPYFAGRPLPARCFWVVR